MRKFKLPTREQIVKIWPLNYLASHLLSPRLWSLRRHTVAYGTALGAFCAFLPIPFQMVVATVACIVLGINLPIALACVWISNPITIPFLFYIAYIVGEEIYPSGVVLSIDNFSSMVAVGELLGNTATTFLVGCLVMGLLAAIVGYVLAHAIWMIWAQRRLIHLKQVKGDRSSD